MADAVAGAHELEDFFVSEQEFVDLKSVNKELKKGKCIIASINVRRLNKNINELEVFINRLVKKPQVTICTETWNIGPLNTLVIEGYDIFYNNSTINRSDGVAILIKEDLVHTIENENVESLKALSCILTCGSEQIKITGVYRCHYYNKKSFIKDVKNYINQNNKYKNHYIIGDFNIDMIDIDKDGQHFCILFLRRNIHHYATK